MKHQLEEAERLVLAGEFAQALEVLKQLDQSFPRVCVEMGRCEAGLSNFDQAALCFELASKAYANLAQLKSTPPPVTVAAPAPVAVSAPAAPAAPARPKFDFYQSADEVFVSLSYKNNGLTAEDVKVGFEPNAVSVAVVPGADAWAFGPLYAAIVPDKCSYKVTKFKIELVLAKQQQQDAASSWPSLEQQQQQQAQQQGLPSAYASKKKPTPTTASVVAKEEEEAEVDDDPLNTLLRKIYKDADEDTRMAMQKSMQTSGGTVLTTNWKEAKEKDFSKDIKPPAGQEFKSWDGKVVAKGDS